MVLHPAVQAKAQAELDSVIGSGRLPDYNDRPSMPYIDAIVKEVLRWNPVAPLGNYSPLMVMISGIYLFFFRSSSYGYQRRHLQWLFHTCRNDDNRQHLVSICSLATFRPEILRSVWFRTILHDERNYIQPMDFMPERFLNPDGTEIEQVLDPATAAFGYGRR